MNSRRKIFWLLIPLALLIALPFPVVSTLEEQDTFCISCHLAPEETYYQRAQDALGGTDTVDDLASAHYLDGEEVFRCIDCHRGDDSLNDRFHAFVLGGKDAVIFLTGQADETLEKAVAAEPGLLNRGCISCHTDVMLELGFNNHYHNQLPAAKAAEGTGAEPVLPPEGLSGDLFNTLGGSETGVTCISCHHAHRSLPDAASTLYMDVDAVLYPACVQCHADDGAGPLDLGG